MRQLLPGSKNARLLNLLSHKPRSGDRPCARHLRIGPEAVARRRQQLVEYGLLDQTGTVTEAGIKALRDAGYNPPQQATAPPARYQDQA